MLTLRLSWCGRWISWEDMADYWKQSHVMSFLTVSLPAPWQDIAYRSFLLGVQSLACSQISRQKNLAQPPWQSLESQVGSHPRGQGRIDGSGNPWTFGRDRPPGSCRRAIWGSHHFRTMSHHTLHGSWSVGVRELQFHQNMGWKVVSNVSYHPTHLLNLSRFLLMICIDTIL